MNLNCHLCLTSIPRKRIGNHNNNNMERAKYTIKEAVKAIQQLDFVEDTCSIDCYIKKMNKRKLHF